MQKFKMNALALIKGAVFQNKPFLLLSTGDKTLTCAYEGNQRELVSSLATAMQNDTKIKRIVLQAMLVVQSGELEPTSFTLKK